MKITSQTKIVGVFGYPVKHTLSPQMHNAAFAQLDLDYAYLSFEVKPDRLGQAVSGLKALNITGVNVTVPHKERVLEYLDELSETAKQLGAVNTIKLENDRLCGYNTDGEGFLASLRQEADYDLKDKQILLLGAGGAAKAVMVSLANQGAGKIVIANRTIGRAEALLNMLKHIAPQIEAGCVALDDNELQKCAAEAQLIINATSVGLKSEALPPIAKNSFHAGQLVYDLVYNPAKTKLLTEAEAGGAKILNGRGMLVYQGALSFEIWTGKKAPVGVMRQAIRTNS